MIKTIRTVGGLILLLSVVPLGLAALWYQKTDDFLQHSVTAEATVIDIEKRPSSDGTVYHYPLFTFTDQYGETHRIRSTFGSNPPSHEIGETILLFYDPTNPKKVKFNTFISLWLGPTILAGVALFPLIIGCLLIFIAPLLLETVDRTEVDSSIMQASTTMPLTEEDEEKGRLWAMLSHMTALSLYAGIPFGNILAPLIIWIMRKNTYPLVDAHGKESLNFQISISIYVIIAFFLCFLFIGFLLLPAILIANIVLVVVASLKADRGAPYRYPINLRLIR